MAREFLIYFILLLGPAFGNICFSLPTSVFSESFLRSQELKIYWLENLEFGNMAAVRGVKKLFLKISGKKS